MSNVLQGIRVLDMTNVLAGPFCAYQLALQGADVIKVEMPHDGDLARQLGADAALNAKRMGASFLAQNAGKRSMTIDLKSEAGKEVLCRLVSTADVLVENFRPGVMARLGLGYETLKKLNPRLVYCAISGFGQDGPLKDAPAYDQIVQGLSGAMSITGNEDSAPLRVGYPVADSIGGLTGAFAIVSALFRRATTGEGAFIDVAMLDATIVTMGWVVSNYLVAGQVPRPFGNDNFTAAPSGAFRTGEGLLNIAANKQDQFVALAKAIGREDLVSDARFSERENRKRHRAALTEEIEKGLASRTAEEWEPVLNQAGVPAGRVLTVPQALAHPQVQYRRLLRTFEDVPGVGRPVTLARAGFRVDGMDTESAVPPPRLGEHTETLLQELGYSGEEIETLKKAGTV